jgi:glycosyltransferase involved in cell wall biosynthesis
MADIILLSTADWDHPLWTNKQHQAVSLAKSGHRVLYIDSLGIRGPRSGGADRRRILRRLGRCLRPLRQVRPGIWVLSPLVLPGRVSGYGGRFNRLSLNLALFCADVLLDLRTPLLWTFNPNSRAYLKLGRFHATIYHCVDRIQSQPGMPVAALERAERELCSKVNAVFTTAPKLQESLQALNAGTHCFGNVADAIHFGRAHSSDLQRPRDLPIRSGPCLMFVGAIDAYKLDLPMLEELIQRTSDWTYVFIGPVAEADPSTDVSRLAGFGNVHLLGHRSYDDLPNYLAHADVALLPLQLNEYTRHMFPMKFFEYLAAGCPVVATAIPSLEDQRDIAWLCPPTVEAFQAAIAAALAGDGPSLRQRLDRSETFTYDSRTTTMLHCLGRHGLLPADPSPPLAMPYHRIRRQLQPSWVGAQIGLLPVRCLDIFGLKRFSRQWLDGMLRSNPDNLEWLNHCAGQALACFDFATARELIERIWLLDGEAELLHQLLFRRGSRPGDRRDQLALFDELATSSVLPLHFAGYCRVVRTYRAIDQKDSHMLRRCCAALTPMIEALSSDPDTYCCLRPNRENRAKLLISAHLTRLRALMELQDHGALDAAAHDLEACSKRYDPFAIDRTTATRMTRNIMRCLAIAAVMAWHSGNGQRFNAVVDEVERLRLASYAERFDPIAQRTQEDHRAFSDWMLERLEPCRWSDDSPHGRPDAAAFVEPILLVYFPALRLERTEKAWRFLTPLVASQTA